MVDEIVSTSWNEKRLFMQLIEKNSRAKIMRWQYSCLHLYQTKKFRFYTSFPLPPRLLPSRNIAATTTIIVAHIWCYHHWLLDSPRSTASKVFWLKSEFQIHAKKCEKFIGLALTGLTPTIFIFPILIIAELSAWPRESNSTNLERT